MSLDAVWVSIRRMKREGDGAGGKIATPFVDKKQYHAVIVRQRKSSSDERLEDGAHGSPGPGVEEATRRVFCFRAPFPTLKVNDVLEATEGSDKGIQYVVHDVRPYGWTLQVDVEVVQ